MASVCRHCRDAFETAAAALAFYDKVSPVIGGQKFSIPTPTLCPDCRQQRRTSWRNERNLYRHTCGLCKKGVISMYAATSPYTVYCQQCWWGDGWDPLRYGVAFDTSRSFFEQFHVLQLNVPRLSLFNMHSENSEYTSHSADNRNCYMGVAFGKCEDCLYGHWVLQSRNAVDCLYCQDCELCYECAYCEGCYHCLFCEYAENDRDCILCFECDNCENCIGCTGLKRQKNHLFNQPATAEDIQRMRTEIFRSRKALEEVRRRFETLKLQTPRRATLQLQCEACTGDELYNCSRCTSCFNCRECQDCTYVYDAGKNRDCMDSYEHGYLVPSELNYDCHGGMAGYHLLFCHICAESRDLTYCDCCFEHCSDCFGCIGLKKKEFCILNKQYTKEEYERLLPPILERMQKGGEFGEFFPTKHSPFAYNESVAMEYFHRPRQEIARFGWQWQERDPQRYRAPTCTTPENIADVPETITKEILACSSCERNYRIVDQELDFYRGMGLPIPLFCHDCRHARRIRLRNPRTLWKRTCMKCKKEIMSTYDPKRPESVYCEECYLKEVY